MKYRITKSIEFEGERHCLKCPIRDEHTDGCKLQTEEFAGDQEPIEFDSWEEQMKCCPLERVSEDGQTIRRS